MASITTKTLALMVRDPSFLGYAKRNDLDPDLYFDNNLESFVGSIVLGLGGKYGRVTLDMLVEELARTRDSWPDEIDLDPSRLKELVRYIFAKEIDDLDYVRDRVSEELAIRKYQAALTQAVEYIENNDLEGLRRLLQEADQDTSITPTSNHGTLLSDIDTCLEEYIDLINQADGIGIPTGITPLDEGLVWKGLGRKELTLVLAPPKRGKTMFMLWCAYHAITKGYNALYISLEVSEAVLGLRLVSCHLSISFDTLLAKPKKHITKFKKWASQNKVGALKLLEVPTKSITANDVRHIVREEIRAGRKPDLVVVDYAKLLKHRHGLKGWEGLGETVEELRGVAGEFGVAMLTGAQGNKASVKRSVLGHDDIGYDFSQIQTADLIIALGKRPEDIPIDLHGRPQPVPMRLFVLPSRNCMEFSVEIQTHYAQGRMYCE